MSEEGFLSRWSRRKRAAEAGQPAEEPVAVEPGPAEPLAPAPEEPPFDITTLPPIESLSIESDFAAFLRKEVPEALKRAALRKAWSLDPAIRDFVGPADYAWDYNAPDGVPGASFDLTGNIKDMLARVFGVPEDTPATASPVAEPDSEAPAPTVDQAVPPAPVALAEAPAAEAADTPAPTPRRHGSALPN